MWATVVDGAATEIIAAAKAITLGEVQYPANIFRLWSDAELAAIGIYPVAIDPAAPDYPYSITDETATFDAENARVVLSRTYTALSVPLPSSVTKLQLIRALREAGHKTAFDTELAAASADTQEDWSLAVRIATDDPLITTFATALGLDADARDALLRRAAEL